MVIPQELLADVNILILTHLLASGGSLRYRPRRILLTKDVFYCLFDHTLMIQRTVQNKLTRLLLRNHNPRIKELFSSRFLFPLTLPSILSVSRMHLVQLVRQGDYPIKLLGHKSVLLLQGLLNLLPLLIVLPFHLLNVFDLFIRFCEGLRQFLIFKL
jgi:hypothetical protein